MQGNWHNKTIANRNVFCADIIMLTKLHCLMRYDDRLKYTTDYSKMQ